MLKVPVFVSSFQQKLLDLCRLMYYKSVQIAYGLFSSGISISIISIITYIV